MKDLLNFKRIELDRELDELKTVLNDENQSPGTHMQAKLSKMVAIAQYNLILELQKQL